MTQMWLDSLPTSLPYVRTAQLARLAHWRVFSQDVQRRGCFASNLFFAKREVEPRTHNDLTWCSVGPLVGYMDAAATGRTGRPWL